MPSPVVAEAHNVEKVHPHPRLHDINQHPKPHVADHAGYAELYEESLSKPEEFWARMARENLSWDRDFKTVSTGDFEHGNMAWFLEGQLNACYNCVDRHAISKPDSVAIIYEADEPGEGRNITYAELLRDVCQLANVLKKMGVKKGDVVTIYMPMIPEALVAFMAIVRLGAVHSVVFAGFSSDSLRDRIINGNSKVVLTTDEGKRGGKNIGTKKIVDDALKNCPDVKHCLVYKRTGSEVPWTKGRDFWWDEETKKYPPYCPCETVSSEDPLFLLYTSGSTGAPKGVLHTTAGYLLGAAMTLKYIFDVHPGDKIGTAGDVGWITGHTYVVYAPLLLGVSTLCFEGTPAYPSYSRYWEVVEKHKITHWYVAPTAIRLLKRAGDDYVKGDLSSLRMLGSVGEPIAPEVFQWYSSVVGKDQCPVVDTYWQTETGSHIIAPLSAAIPTKAGSASLPFFGIEPALVNPESGKEVDGNDVEGVLVIKRPWPSMARTVYGAHERYMDTYLKPYPGVYFTGDGAGRDHEGYYWIRGRVDDVVNVSGHRLSTAEIEAALIQYSGVGEAAVVGFPHELTGQSIAAFVSLKSGVEQSPQLQKDLILQVRKSIGPFAAPSVVLFTELPKTRSGKIMRRILRKVMAGESDSLGDTSTLAEPGVVPDIISAVEEYQKSKK